ncbi:MAG: glycosyltransferase family 4 protein [Candidatus Omnitrophota bacterium]
MKLIYLHQYFNTPDMAGGTRSYEIARRLVAQGHEVHMITTDRNISATGYRRTWHETEEAGIKVSWFAVPYSNHMDFGHRIGAFLKFAWAAAKKAALIKGDIIFATSTPLTIAIPGVYASRKHKIPLVFEVRDLWPEVPVAVGALKNPFVIYGARKLERFAYGNSKKIIALSPGIRDAIVNSGYPENHITTISNGCDIEMFDSSEEEAVKFRQKHIWLEDRPLVVYCGTLGKINGVSYLANIAQAVMHIDPEVRFLVVGGGKEEDVVRVKAQELGVLDKNFFMQSKVPKKEIPAILKAASLAVSLFINIPEMRNNSANKFFDSLAAGTPVAINYGGWQADVLRRTGSGIVLDPENIEGAAHDIINIIHDEKRLISAREAAIKLAREEFSRDVLTTRLEKILQEVVDETNEDTKIR